MFEVEKMRSIALMVAAFNENNKKLARDGMRHAESVGAMPREQYGGRKWMCAALLAMEKVISFDIIRQQNLAAAHKGLDATQCYDRLAHPPSGLAMDKYGGHEAATTSMFNVLQNAEHKVTTAYEVSKSTYGGRKRIQRG